MSDFLFVSSPVLLVLQLPNVGTRLHEATSLSLVVRQTLQIALTYKITHYKSNLLLHLEQCNWPGLNWTIVKLCHLSKLSYCSFVQLSRWDPSTPQPGFHTPPLWQDLTHTTVNTTNYQLHHSLWNITFFPTVIFMTNLLNVKFLNIFSQTLLLSQSLMTCLCLQVKQTWQPLSRWCSCLTLA